MDTILSIPFVIKYLHSLPVCHEFMQKFQFLNFRFFNLFKLYIKCRIDLYRFKAMILIEPNEGGSYCFYQK